MYKLRDNFVFGQGHVKVKVNSHIFSVDLYSITHCLHEYIYSFICLKSIFHISGVKGALGDSKQWVDIDRDDRPGSVGQELS